jgi:hypothetical protein
MLGNFAKFLDNLGLVIYLWGENSHSLGRSHRFQGSTMKPAAR